MIAFVIFLSQPVEPSNAMGTGNIVSMRPAALSKPFSIQISKPVRKIPCKVCLKFNLFTKVNERTKLNSRKKLNDLRIKNKVIYSLRAGDLKEWVAKFGVTGAVIIILYNLHFTEGLGVSKMTLPKEFCTPRTPRLVHKPGDSSRSFRYKSLSRLNVGVNLEDEKFVYSQSKAVKIIEAFVPATVEVGIDHYKISGFQASKKLKHAKGMGSDLESFNCSQEEFNRIDRNGGLVQSIRRGEKLPNIELVKEYQENIRKFCNSPETRTKKITLYHDPNCPGTYFYDQTVAERGAIFDDLSGDLIWADKVRNGTNKQILNSGNFGQAKVPSLLEKADVASKSLNLEIESLREISQRFNMNTTLEKLDSENPSSPNLVKPKE